MIGRGSKKGLIEVGEELEPWVGEVIKGNKKSRN